MRTIEINGQSLSLKDIKDVWRQAGVKIEFASAARERVQVCRDHIESAMRENKIIYGVNTGFGKFSEVKIPPEKLMVLQENLVLSHAAGIGDPFPPEIVRIILLLKANTLAKGYSGCRPVIIDHLIKMLNAGLLPRIPEKGSVGASGDLAPLAHLSLVLIGRGEAFWQDKWGTGAEAMAAAKIPVIRLREKEGLALLNGTQVTTAVAACALLRLLHLVKIADILGAMSLEALTGTPTAFDPRIHKVRGLPGQIRVADNLIRLLKESPIRISHEMCPKIQDAYSLRCMPQVHGAVRDALNFVQKTIEIEINAATDNPLIFSEEGDILSGGNFHAQPIALVSDILAIAAAQLANISERRIEYMLDPNMSCLAGFLTEEGGLNSGFMLAQVTAASLVSENKTLAHPASVDSIPTSANKEDFVSMGTWAARKALQIVDNCEHVLAIELMCAAQGMDFRKPLKSSPVLDRALNWVREKIPHWEKDRYMAPEIEQARQIIKSEEFLTEIESFIGDL